MTEHNPDWPNTPDYIEPDDSPEELLKRWSHLRSQAVDSITNAESALTDLVEHENWMNSGDEERDYLFVDLAGKLSSVWEALIKLRAPQ